MSPFIKPVLLALCLAQLPVAGADEKALPAYAHKIQTPKIEFRDTTLRDTLNKLPTLAKQASPNEKLPALVLIGPTLAQRRITVEREAGKLEDAIRAVAAQAGCEIDWEPRGIVLREQGTPPVPQVLVEKGAEELRAKLAQHRLPRVEFSGATVRESCEFLIQKSKHVSIVLDGGGRPGTEIHFVALDLPFLDTARYIAGQAGLKVSLERYRMVIGQKDEPAAPVKK